jgi:hypothetical protein
MDTTKEIKRLFVIKGIKALQFSDLNNKTELLELHYDDLDLNRAQHPW